MPNLDGNNDQNQFHPGWLPVERKQLRPQEIDATSQLEEACNNGSFPSKLVTRLADPTTSELEREEWSPLGLFIEGP